MAMSLKGAQSSAPLPQQTAPVTRRWRVQFNMVVEGEIELDSGAVVVAGPEAWVTGGHLFVGTAKTNEWTHAWAPGGWLSIELMAE